MWETKSRAVMKDVRQKPSSPFTYLETQSYIQVNENTHYSGGIPVFSVTTVQLESDLSCKLLQSRKFSNQQQQMC